MTKGANRNTRNKTALEVLRDNQIKFKDLFDQAKAFLDNLDAAKRKEVPSIANAYLNTLKPNNSLRKRVKSEVPANPSKLYCYESFDDSPPPSPEQSQSSSTQNKVNAVPLSPFSEQKNYASKVGVALSDDCLGIYSPGTIRKRIDFLRTAPLQPQSDPSTVKRFK